jgi:hypothetical protein
VTLAFSKVPIGFGIPDGAPPVEPLSGLGLSPRGEILLTAFDFASEGGLGRRDELREQGLWIEGSAAYALRFPWIPGKHELVAGPRAAGAGVNDLRIEGAAGPGSEPAVASMEPGARFTVEVRRAEVAEVRRHAEKGYVGMEVDLHLVARHPVVVCRGADPIDRVEATLELRYRGPLELPDGEYPWLPR